ncbi:unnamed protein product [Caenorhabditis angaria]|uniref:Uncharacterized protein n=1 Tax=Caenorhabditis angaria TaxID=860376 RepID=A0A9P1MT11_9PELO|nr:unnamed protein product [Caenorhabditis angaria]
MAKYFQLILFCFAINLIFAQYQPQSNIEQFGRQPLRQCSRQWERACQNGECIAGYDWCDSIPQCSDGSDEWNCDNVNRNVAANEGNAREPPISPTTAKSIVSTTVSNSLKGTVTIEYSHLIFAIGAFIVLSIMIITLIKRRSRKKPSGFRNRRGNILQQDSDEDDILISSMYS